ncbi:MAG: alkaline phosphatase family protein [Candidatus Marinimicrobia bacterium]|nr:alkaline phosphatase family protein [Candidatus Neomarinimicrobiota bacterium]MBL7010071.1 alkaline phosphatase family protein [Candidatus Neomarinimicrobiota bacterium]MBL7030340.1 alkaline phosphatase family protein [Candidatus Neomarinimicrobiota bacterium]
MKKWFLMPLVAAFFFVGCSDKKKPKLVVFIVVDQGMPELLNKYDHLFTGGYRWLKDNGISFSNTHHDYGYTVTGPGHFVLSSGRYPSSGGVIGNFWFNRDTKESWYCVEDTIATDVINGNAGRSYKNINVTTLGDWLKTSNLNAKVVSISGKDRAAVLLGGKNPDMSLWYGKHGGWTTSTYYSSNIPDWVSSFNSQLNVPSYVDTVWNRLLDESIYTSNTRADHYEGEADWSQDNGYSPTFPITFKERGIKSMLGSFPYTPFGDAAMLQLGLIATEKHELGEDENTDILFLGLSATDGVGHEFGPHSHEQLDNYLRVDKHLGSFIESIESSVGIGNTLYILTSDHGSIELPEYLKAKGIDAGRISKPTKDSLYTDVKTKIELQIGINKVYRNGNSFYYNDSMNQLERELATDILKSSLLKLDGIRSVITKKEILEGGNSVYERRLKNMVHPQKSPDVFLIPKEYWTFRFPYGASHGTPYDYDTHIPLLFSRGGFNSKVNSKRIESVDIAPTISKYLNVQFPENIDGKAIPLEE